MVTFELSQPVIDRGQVPPLREVGRHRPVDGRRDAPRARQTTKLFELTGVQG